MATQTHPIKVSEDTWQELNRRKTPGDTFDDVVVRLLDDETETE
jgi:predicted CopG family antitoxin